VDNFISILLGIFSSLIASLVFWLVFFKVSRTKVEFSPYIAKSKNTNEFPGLNRYRIKFINSGKRDLIDINFLVEISVKKGDVTNYTSLGIGNDNKIPILLGEKKQHRNIAGLGGAQILTLYPIEATFNEFRKSFYSNFLRTQSMKKELCIDDIFTEFGNNVKIVIFVYGNDALTGTRKMFVSSIYKNENVKFGKYQKTVRPSKKCQYSRWVSDILSISESTQHLKEVKAMDTYNINKKRKKESIILGKILKEVAPQIGAEVLLEPEWNITGQIIFKNGQKSFFRYNALDLNPMGASEVAKDKDYASFFMKSMGYPVVPSKAFFSKNWAKAIGGSPLNINAAFKYAQEIGFPVVLKPNSRSHGFGVSLVSNKAEFYKAAKIIFVKDNIMLVQKLIKGKDYRIVVLDNEVISIYQRLPLSIVGDGKSTIRRLLHKKQEQFIEQKRNTKINFHDPRIKSKLKRQKLTFFSILQEGTEVFLLDNANLSSGGTSIDVSNKAVSFYKDFAIKLTHDMGLRLCGVDLMIDGDISEYTDTFHILEINAAPGLDHYAKSGEEQENIVKNLYIKVLEQLEKGNGK